MPVYKEQWIRSRKIFKVVINSNMSRNLPRLYFSDPEDVNSRVIQLWNIPHIEQRSTEWFQARNQCLTASSISSALTRTEDACRAYIEEFKLHDTFTIDPKKTCNYREQQQDLIMSKCGLGQPFTGNDYTRWGQLYENVVSVIYSQMFQVDVLEFGLLLHSDAATGGRARFLGASPDGITTQGVMLEIKCPSRRPVSDIISLGYWMQVLLQLECTGLDECDFFDARFLEYDSQDDWTADAQAWESTHAETLYHSFGIIIVVHVSSDDVEYVRAPPTTVKYLDFLRWAADSTKKLTNEGVQFEVKYYKLEEYKLRRVKRNSEWFEKNLPTMKDVWRRIEFGRTPEGFRELQMVKDEKERMKTERREKKEEKILAGGNNAGAVRSSVLNGIYTKCLL